MTVLTQSLRLLALPFLLCTTALGQLAPTQPADASVLDKGWLSWRGPAQLGTSTETGLFDTVTVEGEQHAWTYDMAGRGSPVIANGRLFGLGYDGKGETLQEVLFCLDAYTGKEIWAHRFPEFLSDLIYSRYAIGSPTIDPATGHVYSMTAAGLLHAWTQDGEMLWQRSLGEDLGRLTFPNGRTGAPLIVGDLVIMHFIFASWGPMGPARDRFYAFNKVTGEVVWGCTPGGPPKDSSFSMPIVEERGGKTVIYAGLGGGHVVCVDARTGDPQWRFQLAVGGVNSSALIHGDKLIVIHGKENLDSSVIGRMIALDLTQSAGDDGVLPKEAELWRNDLVAFTSSPVLVEDRVYATTLTGELNCVDVNTGEIDWHMKLGTSQLHASPLYADGKLYIPLADGTFSIVRPGAEGGELLDQEQLEGSCLGAPALCDGLMYVHTTEKLYCFGTRGDGPPAWPMPAKRELGAVVRLQPIPADVVLQVGEVFTPRVRRLDAEGDVVDVQAAELQGDAPKLVSRAIQGGIQAEQTGAGVITVGFDGLQTKVRVRVVDSQGLDQDFNGISLNQGDESWAWPPGHWLGGRMKWRIVDLDGERVATRNMLNPLFQRTMTMIGDGDDSNYTIQLDLMSEGNRRSMSSVGVINQRYQIVLKGNYQAIEVSSNMEHLKVSTKFKWKPKVWYTMRSRVDMQEDGSAVIRVKVWERGDPEPEAWTAEVTDPHGHTQGAPGLYGFTPQSRFTVYIDNLSITPNQ